MFIPRDILMMILGAFIFFVVVGAIVYVLDYDKIKEKESEVTYKKFKSNMKKIGKKVKGRKKNGSNRNTRKTI